MSQPTQPDDSTSKFPHTLEERTADLETMTGAAWWDKHDPGRHDRNWGRTCMSCHRAAPGGSRHMHGDACRPDASSDEPEVTTVVQKRQECFLKHEDQVSGKRMEAMFHVSAETFTGPLGGVRIPTRVLWKPTGTGLFQLGTHDEEGEWVPALWPCVEWHNGDEKSRYEPLPVWLKKTGRRPMDIFIVELAKKLGVQARFRKDQHSNAYDIEMVIGPDKTLYFDQIAETWHCGLANRYMSEAIVVTEDGSLESAYNALVTEMQNRAALSRALAHRLFLARPDLDDSGEA